MASGTLFGGPLSTRAACTNWDAIERLRQQEEAAAAARARKLAKLNKASDAATKRNNTPPPPDPSAIRKNKIKEDLDLFDDLNTDGAGPKKSTKPVVRATTPPAQKSDNAAYPSTSGARRPFPAKAGALDPSHRSPHQAKSALPGKPGPAGKAPVAGVRPAPQPGSSGPGRPAAAPGQRPAALGTGAPGRAPGSLQGQAASANRPGQHPSAAQGTRPGSAPARPGPQPNKRPLPAPGRGPYPHSAYGGRGGGSSAPHPRGPPSGFGRPLARQDSFIDDDTYDDSEGFVVDDEGEEEWRRELRGLTGYDPRRFKDYGDDRAMVAGWRDVQAEEKRSERMGRAEDDIAEEEERRAKAAKLKTMKAHSLAKKARLQ